MKNRKLLLIAMSGIRVKSKELMALGMTLPGFVERSRVIASLPSLSLLTLAAHTPAHWQVEYREMADLRQDDVAQLARGQFDLIAITSLAAMINEAYSLADDLRALGIKVVLGGLHVSALPMEAMRHADSVVQGEGEVVWKELIADFEAGRLKPIYSSLDGSRPPFSMRDALVPRYDLLDISKYNRLTIQTARGCPHHCVFCAASRTISSYKLKPPAQIRRELEAILTLWPRPFIELADDNTFVQKAWGREVANILAEYPIKWFTETDISVADDDRLLGDLARSHCAQILVGFESAAPESLKGVDVRNWKYRRFETYSKKIRHIQSHGITVNGCFILGFDTDGPEVFDQTLEFARASGLAEVQITLLTPFPGTLLHSRLKQEGRLLREEYWDECTLFDVTFRPKRMSPRELEQGFHQLMQDLYSQEAVRGRKKQFRQCVRQGRERRRHRHDMAEAAA